MGQVMGDDRTKVEKSDLEVVVTRVFDAPVRLVYDAWTKAELFRLWWLPRSMGMTMAACEMDVRVGGGYRLEIRHGENAMTFFGKYTQVVPRERLVWTNDESEGGAVTTVTFEEQHGRTLVVLREAYPSKEAREAFGGMEDGLPEPFRQLDELLANMGAKV